MQEILAKGMYPNKEEATLLGGHIHTAALHMQELIDTILKLSRIEDEGSEVLFKQTSIRSVINSAWQQLATKRQGKNITLAITGESPSLLLSPKLIEEVFINLFDNAIKFSKTWIIILLLIFAPKKALPLSASPTKVSAFLKTNKPVSLNVSIRPIRAATANVKAAALVLPL